MARYPPILTNIRHNPRPTTEVLAKAEDLRIQSMSTSPSLQPEAVLGPPLNTIEEPTFDEEPVDYPQFLLLGDSITQFSTLTLQAYLQTQYIRRLDVVNRGFSGFTAPMGFRALNKLLPPTGQHCVWPRIELVTVFFGANDACLPGNPQHVSIQQYVDTLDSIIRHSAFHQPASRRTAVILITPPPVNEHQFEQAPSGPFQRRAGVSSQYARAATQVALTHNVSVLDFWSVLMRKVGWNSSMGRDCCCEHLSHRSDSRTILSSSEMHHIPGCHAIPARLPNADWQLSDFLTDGLHLTKLGYDILFLELMKLVRAALPECAPESLPFVLPEWRNALSMIMAES